MFTANTKEGKIVDVVNKRIYCGKITIENGRISNIIEIPEDEKLNFILPGFVDAHIHIESSMLIPSSFAKVAVKHGTVACICDPHEIANVVGIDGIKFMIDNAASVPLKFFFGAPSCVPATIFETSGAKFFSEDIENLFLNYPIYFLAEMMNFPGVINKDNNVYQLLEIAKKFNKPIDGHAPGLTGENAKIYAQAGITTDHECMNIDEAIEKISYGMKIQIREGSAAKNFNSLVGLLASYPESVMFCSDDKHPDDLLKGHINSLAKKAIENGYDIMNVLRACSYNPIKHYKLDVGLLQIGDSADFIVCNNLQNIDIIETFISGNLVFDGIKVKFDSLALKPINIFNCEPIEESDLSIIKTSDTIQVIKVSDGSLLTESLNYQIKANTQNLQSIIEHDILKIVVINRYKKAPPAIAFANGFGIKNGAIASSIAHDSHNIIAIGTSDALIAKAINIIIKNKGGICYVSDFEEECLPLAYAGLMTADDATNVALRYENINFKVQNSGSRLIAPFMTLSFMALLVIPHLKIGDKGLFDVKNFELTSTFI